MSASIRLSDAIAKWEQAMVGDGMAVGTINTRLSTMRYLMRVTGDLYVKSITVRHIDEVFSVYADKWKRGSTRNKSRLHLHAFFKWAITRGYYTGNNPLEGRRKPPMGKTKHTYLSLDQFNEMIDLREEPRDRILLALMYYLTIRISEAIKITWGDVTDDLKLISVLRSKKGEAYEVELAIPPRLGQELKRWRAYLCGRMGTARPNPAWYVVCPRPATVARDTLGHYQNSGEYSYTPESPLLYQGYRIVKNALAEIGVKKEGEACHVLRRSGGDRIRREGDAKGLNGLRLAQLQFGHQSQSTTETYLDEDRDRQMLNEFMWGLDDEPDPAPQADIIPFPKAMGGA